MDIKCLWCQSNLLQWKNNIYKCYTCNKNWISFVDNKINFVSISKRINKNNSFELCSDVKNNKADFTHHKISDDELIQNRYIDKFDYSIVPKDMIKFLNKLIKLRVFV